MKDYLEHYEGKIYALSPIYVGSGEKIKRMHIFMRREIIES